MTGVWLLWTSKWISSDGSVSFPVSSFSTSRLKSSFGSFRALCNQSTIEVLPVLGEDVKSGLRQAPFAAGPETV
jgi:hypothetical protein